MGTFYSGSGSASGSLGSLTRLASEFEPMVREFRIGHLAGAPVSGAMPGGKNSFLYHLRNTFVNGSDINSGQRLVGQPVPQAEPGQWKDVSAYMSDYGEEVPLDHADGWMMENPDDMADRDEFGTRLALTHCLDAIDKRFASVVTTASSWTTSDAAASAAWTTSTTDFLGDIQGQKDAYEAAVGEPLGENLACVMSTKTWDGLKDNANLTTLWGGNSGIGRATDEQVRSALSGVGITQVFVGSFARYAGNVVVYKRPSVSATPSGRLSAAAGIITPYSGSSMIQVSDPREIDQRRTGYHAFMHGEPAVILPEFGFLITGASS